jgi:hypothetical protein
MLPPVAVQLTVLLKGPVPLTVATQVEVLSDVMEGGFAVTAIPVTVTGIVAAETFMEAVPDFVPS